MRWLFVAHMIDYGAFKPYKVIEKVPTIDGLRDRITNLNFETLEEAQAYIKEQEAKRG